MSIEEIKKLLKDLRKNRLLLSVLQRRIEKKESDIQFCKSDSMTQTDADSINVLRERYRAVLTEINKAEAVIDKSMEVLTPTEQVVLMERYLSGTGWAAIAVKVNYSEPQVYRIARDSMEKLSKMIVHDSNLVV